VKHSVLTLRKTVIVLGASTALLVVVALVSVAVGPTGVSLGELWGVLTSPGRPDLEMPRLIILDIRLPRVLLALIVGAGLSIAGTTFQAMLRNPLAEPYILGISSGGTIGAVLAIAIGTGLTQFATPVMSFAGSGLVMLLVFALGRRRGFMDPHALLLSGVMVGAFFNAIILLVVSLLHQELRTAFLWLLGNLSDADFGSLLLVGPLIVLASALLMMQGRSFNLISTGDETATYLGVDVPLVQKRSYLLASFITGLAVSVSGVIGFVGLLVPHSCRLLFGPDHRLLLPASFVAGGIFLILCDLLSRIVLAPAEIPVGAITALVGAPLFIYLLKRS